jgi:hypothetical protein
MPSEESKLYLELKGKLENLSGGVKKHSADKDFPSNITAEVIDTKVTDLITARKAYDTAAAISNQKFEEYDKLAKECETLFSNISTQLYGIYGKQNLTVADYGLKTYQRHTGRKTKTETTAAAK